MGDKRIFTRATEEFRERVRAAAEAAGSTIEDWVLAALTEKLLMAGASMGDIGPLARLRPRDRRRAERYIDLLYSTHDETLKRAIDQNFMLFERASGKRDK